ncbi:MAG: MFS transporter [Steroidobacteraceae bacterium]
MRGGLPHGWQVLIASVVGAAISPATLINVPFGLFIRALEQEHHWPRAGITAALSGFLGLLIVALPAAGWLVDRVGPRRVALPSILGYGLALALLPRNAGSTSMLALSYGCIAVLSAGAQSLTFVRALCAWFDRGRGLAIGACMAGYGIGYLFVPPLTQWMIASWGWRGAYAGLGLLAVGVALPVSALLLHDSPREPQASREPQDSREPPAPREPRPSPTSLRAALRSRELWLLAGTFVLMSMALNGVQSQLVPLLTDRGMSAAQAALMLSAIGVGSFPGRLLIGALLDRVFAPHLAMACFATAAVALLWLVDGAGNTGIVLAAVTVGLSLGAENDILGYLTGRYFGLACFGRLYGLLLGAYLLGAAAGPYLMARAFAATGSYGPALQAGAAAIAVACTLQLGMRRYARGEQVDARTG